MSAGARTPVGRRARRAILAALAALVGLPLVLEGALRLLGLSAPIAEPPAYVADLALHFRPAPGALVDEASGERLNADGYRDRDRPVERPDGVRRVLVAGDSFVFGLGVRREEAFPARLEEHLERGRAGGLPPAEVWNLGVSGFGTIQERTLLAREVPRLRPDAVVLAFYVGNDLFENLFVGDIVVVGGRLVPAAFRDALSDEGILRATEWEIRLRRSRLYSLLTRAGLTGPVVRLFLTGAPEEARRRAAEVQASRAEAIAAVYRSFSDPAAREDDSVVRAWDATLAALDGLRADLEAARVPWILAVIPDVDQVRALLEGGLEAARAAPLPWAHGRLRDWAARSGLPSLDFLEPFLAAEDPLALYEPGAHWSEAGHALAADRLAAALRSGGFPGPGR